jgi:hypothetical protein
MHESALTAFRLERGALAVLLLVSDEDGSVHILSSHSAELHMLLRKSRGQKANLPAAVSHVVGHVIFDDLGVSDAH